MWTKGRQPVIRTWQCRSLLSVAVVAAALAASAPSAEAGAVRVKFTPPFGSPFPDLSWGGEAVMDDGSCNTTGSPVWNVGSGSPNCNGEFGFLSAELTLYETANPGNSRTISFSPSQFGTVVAVDRDNTTTANAIYSSPFDPVQVDDLPFAPSQYNAKQAWFSLIFVGEYAQLYWFEKDPGEPLLDPLEFPYVKGPNAYYYLPGKTVHRVTVGGCYQPGDHEVGIPYLVPKMHCGISDADNARGARLQITAVPEPQTLALAFAALGLAAALRRRRSR